jgi:hypothetical protein
VTDEVKFTDAQWDELARAAEAFATVLDEQRDSLRDVLISNWAGSCAEGADLIKNLRELTNGEAGSFHHAIGSESDYLRALAVQCRTSKATLQSADDTSAEQYPQ